MKHAIFTFLVALMAVFSTTTMYVDDAAAKPKQAEDPSAKEFDKFVKLATKAYSNGEYDEALQNFQNAYAVKQHSSILYNIGRVCEEKADYSCAIENYQKFLMSPGSDDDAREDAKDRIKSCQETLALVGAAPARAKSSSSKAEKPAVVGCVDINTAGVKDLTRLNGIGEAYANNIIEYRKNNGNFKKLEDLLNVNRIGAKTLEKIKADICPIAGAPEAAAPVKQVAEKPAPAAAKKAAQPASKAAAKPAGKKGDNSTFQFDI